ncbi:hypothetical protein EIN_122300 [Entamoeba invadens IP1]|uniref:Leucine rich repeat containing protein BspA family protein n=1 Tax=Entamoeba invadens IP1 TaxID=370355 RepID=A0A0A1UG39_ENTIV|nr:hypothetical protein EIN_122300 [Entamoeba invadens IP1]ELP92319.1 hypothetical protein EIN_122300 [Entamoeba invadens IP1]|eukprot:XP_004259090.1 hypothetical protein EIN_122300 [Entamoeba invadens IP1]
MQTTHKTYLNMNDMKVVARYFESLADFVTLGKVCPYYRHVMTEIESNPFPIDRKTLKAFPALTTLNIWNTYDEHFGNSPFAPRDGIADCAQKKEVFSLKKIFFPQEYKRETSKVDFSKIRVYYEVDYTTYRRNCDEDAKYEYHNVVLEKDDVVICDETIPDVVRAVKSHCFENNTTLRSVVVPLKVTSLDQHVFSGCSNLSAISLPNALCDISTSCFQNCVRLEEINIPPLVTSIDANAFDSCSRITHISLPSAVSFLNGSTFANCVSLCAIDISGVVALGEKCFYNCRSLSDVRVAVLTRVENKCFCGCEKLSVLCKLAEQQSLKASTFEGCSLLTSIELCGNFSTIEGYKTGERTDIMGVLFYWAYSLYKK